MKMDEFEKRIRKHAGSAKSYIMSPFDIEMEELSMENKNFSIKKLAFTLVIGICLIGTSAFAVYKFLSAKQVANELGDTKLAEYFSEDGIISETKTDGEYKATILGMASGEKISKFNSSAWELYPERSYVAVAIEKTDGTAMTYDDEIMVTPLIEGLSPWEYNIVTMHGGYFSKIIDGVLYRIIESDSLEYFADRNVYIAVVDKVFLNNEHYKFEESTGHILENESYKGTNMLFNLKLDSKKANPKKAEEYIKSLEMLDENVEDQLETEEFKVIDNDGEIKIEKVN